MSSLVLELQREALDSKISITNVLRKALVVAEKLEIHEFQKWIELELNGYEKLADVPAYRKMHGSLKGHNPYHGWQPILIPDP